ncbi:MAG: beta-lactamase [Candidatus Amesbacteria bacterium GW2011_GWA2_42_12]|uniref:Beta-lactamase n=1 Tax=Candidatus Amesbacteria bacterium GW2011_GWA2_42_12 TaxID=1618356 RepID=A0A0G0Y7L4_9BACT|nr:MAG: beta-lactamase [Candidatus Amesbacteria bacterium GW2011_GWA2_42_12]
MVNRKFIFWVFVVTGIVSGILWWWGSDKKELILFHPLKVSYTVEQKKFEAEKDQSSQNRNFLSTLQDKIGKLQGTYAIYVFRLSKNKGYGINEDLIMPAASIMKVPIMLAVRQATSEGKLTWDTKYTLKDEDKRSGSGPIEFMDAGSELTVQQLTEYMIKNSDNTASMVLSNMLGRDVIDKEILLLGMEHTNFRDYTTTAFDVGLMWRKIYEMKNEDIFNLFKDSIYEDRLPAGLPDTVDVIHKVGTGDGVWVDAGIVMPQILNPPVGRAGPKSQVPNIEPLVIVILNKGVDASESAKMVPTLTKEIWEYETQSK